MMRVVTRNSVYSVKLTAGGMFQIKRLSSMWGQKVKDNHEHYSRMITVGVGNPMITSGIRTTNVLTVIPD